MKKAKMVVLIVEDEPNDILLLKRTFTKIGINPDCIFDVHDGGEAIDYLLSKNSFEDRKKYPFPDIVISDLKMPRKNGFELLTWLKDNPIYKVIPTIIFSSSNEERDVRQAYYLGANSYLTKPGSTGELEDLMKSALEYWKKCELPT